MGDIGDAKDPNSFNSLTSSHSSLKMATKKPPAGSKPSSSRNSVVKPISSRSSVTKPPRAGSVDLAVAATGIEPVKGSIIGGERIKRGMRTESNTSLSSRGSQ
jgi:hypothetical protein